MTERDVGSFARLLEQEPLLLGPHSELLQFSDEVAMWLRGRGGIVTDIGFDFSEGRTEMVIATPNGERVECQFRVI